MKIDLQKGYYSNLLSWGEITNLINIRPLMTTRRVIYFSDENYTWRNCPWTHDDDCFPPTLLKEILEKGVCYLTDMSRCTENINSFAAKLEEEYHQPVDAHIYMCVKDIEHPHPFGIHFDKADNVIVQCEGKTNFKVWNKVSDKIANLPKSLIRNMEFPDPPVIDVDMENGDAIWVPAGCPHLATSITPRLSVSFCMPPNCPENDYDLQDREWIRL